MSSTFTQVYVQVYVDRWTAANRNSGVTLRSPSTEDETGAFTEERPRRRSSPGAVVLHQDMQGRLLLRRETHGYPLDRFPVVEPLLLDFSDCALAVPRLPLAAGATRWLPDPCGCRWVPLPDFRPCWVAIRAASEFKAASRRQAP